MDGVRLSDCSDIGSVLAAFLCVLFIIIIFLVLNVTRDH